MWETAEARRKSLINIDMKGNIAHSLRPLGLAAACALPATAVAARDRRRRNDTADGDGHSAENQTRDVPQVQAGGICGKIHIGFILCVMSDRWG